MPWIISALFFLSGLTGLLYEILWAKYLALTLGSTAVAQTATLALFLGGLALGNAGLGPKTDQARNPLRLYALLELGIAALGLLSGLLLKSAPVAAPAFAQALFCALLILPPTILMGGTLPALSRLATRRIGELQGAVAWFYFLNSAGAASGALLAGFFLIPSLGLDASIRLAACLNLAIGGAALGLAGLRQAPPRWLPARSSDKDIPEKAAPLPLLLVVVFASGFASLGYEVAWTRLLALVLGSSAYSFSLMLAAFITGIALGSLFVALRWHPRQGPLALLGWAELGLAISILATLRLYDKLPWLALLLDKNIARTPGTFYLYEAFQLMMCFLLMLPPTTFLGMTLPLASRAAARGIKRVGGDVGRVFSLNTLGNVLGAAASGLWLMPRLGMEGLIEAGVAVNLAASGAVLWRALPWSARRKAALGLGCLLLLGVHLWAPPWDRVILSNGPFRNASDLRGLPSFRFRVLYDAVHRAGRLIYYKDGREATVSVFDKEGVVWLKVNGKVDASSYKDMGTQVLMAHLPFLHAPGAKDALLVGLGGGVTAGSILTHPVDRLDVAEISPDVAEASHCFDKVNGTPLRDPRLHLAIEDGRSFLARSRRRYDLIISEPSNPWIAGVGNLFSEEFDRDARARLKPGGVMAQWFHLYEMSDDTLRMIARTFASVFPHVALWQTHPYDIVLLGSDNPLEPDFAAIQEAFSKPAVREDLARVGARRLATIFSLQMAGEPTLRALAGAGPLNSDVFPRLEYEAPKAFFLDKESSLPYDFDDRAGAAASRQLPLERYLAFRRKPLDRAEYREIADFHGIFGTRHMLRHLADWLRRFPADANARLFLAQAQKDAGETAAARRTLEPLLAKSRASAPALELGAGLAEEPARRLALLRRLAALKEANKADVFEKIARVYEPEDYEKAVSYLGKAAAAAAGRAESAQAASLWMQAALAAIKRYDVPLAISCARRALEQNPGDRSAQTMIQGLLRVEAFDRAAAER